MVRALYLAKIFYLYNSFITHVPFYTVRHWYLRRVLRITLARRSSVHMGCFLSGDRISIGAGSTVNRDCRLDGRYGIEIGSNVSISPGVSILSVDHDPQSPSFDIVLKKTIVEDYVWIGVRAIVLPGVILGRGTVVGAGAVVTRSTEPFSIVAGNPARKIGERNRDLTYRLRYRPLFNTDFQV